jgi:Ca2+-binding EF-hand superfamily protein
MLAPSYDIETADISGESSQLAEIIAAFGREVLGMDKVKTRHEFRNVVMQNAGVYTTDACVDNIFQTFCDDEKNGTISAEDLGRAIVNIKPSSLKDRRNFIMSKCITYLPMYLAACNGIASACSAQANLRERHFGDLHMVPDHSNWKIAATFDLIGNFGYVILEYCAQRQAYENEQLVIQRFLVWIYSDLPRLLRDEGMLEFSGDLASRKLDLVRSLSCRVQEASDKEFHIDELRRLLERANFYISEQAFSKIFNDMDTDNSGTASLDEVGIYAGKQYRSLGKESIWKKRLIVYKRCLLRLGFYISMLFSLGAMFWMTFSFTQSENTDFLFHMLGMTTASYLSAAIGSMYFLVDSTGASMEQVEYVDSILRSTAILFFHQGGQDDNDEDDSEDHEDDGFIIFDKSVVDSSSMSFDKRDSSIKRRDNILSRARESVHSASGSSNWSSYRTDEINASIRADSTTKEEDSDETDAILLSQEEALETIQHSSASGMQRSDSARSQFLAQAKGARELFKLADIDNDASLNEMELFSALTSLGVLVPTSIFSIIFKRIDKSGDGIIQPNEFSSYVGKIKPTKTFWERNCTIISAVRASLSFYLVLVKICAGSFQTTAAYGENIDLNTRRNLFLTGSFGWFIGSIYLLLAFPKNIGQLFDLVETTKFMFKQAIVKESQDHHERKIEEQRQRMSTEKVIEETEVEEEELSDADDDEYWSSGDDADDDDGVIYSC